MNRKALHLLACITLLATFPLAARGMSIHDFGRMNDDDEASYVTLLVEGSAHYYKVQGQPQQARQIIAFFKIPGKDGGVYKFADRLRETNAYNHAKAINPNNRAPELQVEDAMSRTLQDQGYLVPTAYLLTVGKDFSPDGLPRAQAPSPLHP
jgi:hypothetical protein